MSHLSRPISDGGASTMRWFFAGTRGATAVPGLVLIASYAGFGGLAHGVGLPAIATVLSTIFIWALPAQVILVGGIGAGASLPALALAVCLSGVRLLPMVVSLLPLMRGRRPNLMRELICAHFVAVTMWAEAMRQLPGVAPEGRTAYAMGLGCGLVSLSVGGTLFGYFLMGALPPPLAVALLMLTPLSFTILLVRNAQLPMDWLAIAFGAVLAPFVANAPGGLDLFWSGVGGGTLAFLAAEMIRRMKGAQA
ncbi:AzlC family ABC transporter permease [Ancylobacter sp. 6x-1]|uniref:AzlC family ABC transporter permease n=1 Tax=Ancylobacter crimeensis TaxID=2579147 RepID=A0ABT0DC92_9HYPH|nr:AzlC family ABC transporter permease [Ancylobacter crimeensis]MCK0197583.1 AzlC family ABC transporter permease [Ancylobacter crimeensis]